MSDLSKRIYTTNTYKKIKNKLELINSKVNPFLFINLRLITTFIILIVLLIFLKKYSYLAIIISIIYYYLFEYILLERFINKRNNILEENALDYFPVFLLIYSKTKNIKKSFDLTNETVDNELSNLFKEILKESKYGKTFDESLEKLLTILDSNILKNIIISISCANKFGNNIDKEINIFLEELRDKKEKNIISFYKYIPLKLILIFISFTIITSFIIILLKHFK